MLIIPTCGPDGSVDSKSKAYGLDLSSSTLNCVMGLCVVDVVLDLPNFSVLFLVWEVGFWVSVGLIILEESRGFPGVTGCVCEIECGVSTWKLKI